MWIGVIWAAAAIAQSIYAGTLDGTAPDESDTAAYAAWQAQVADQAQLIGASVGYITSAGLASNVSNGGSIAQSGVVNNYLNHTESWALEHAREDLAACEASGNCSAEQIVRLENAVSTLVALDQERDAALRAACTADQFGSACTSAIADALIAVEYYSDPLTTLPGLLGETGYAEYARRLENGMDGHPREGFVEDVYAHRESGIALLAEFRPSTDYTQTQLANANGLIALAGLGGAGLALVGPQIAAGAALLGEAGGTASTYGYVMCTTGGVCTNALTGLAVLGVGTTAYDVVNGDPSTMGIAASGPYGTLMVVEEITGIAGMFRNAGQSVVLTTSRATNNATRGADDVGAGTVGTGLVGDGQSFAGHGGIQANADGSLPRTTVPEGTFVTVPIGPNRALYDNAGQLIESGNVPSGMSVQTGQSLTDPRYLADTTTGAVTYLPGSEIPNYQLIPPNYFPNQPVNPLSNSTVVDTPTPLSQLLQPNAGCVNWAACTTVYGSPTTTPNFGGIDP